MNTNHFSFTSPITITSNVTCKNCDSGRYIVKGDDTQHDSIDDCKYCMAGKEFVSATSFCTVCSAGQYQSSSNTPNAVCQSCMGSYILDDKKNETNHDSINACKFCPPGREFFNTTSPCSICSAGKYQNSSSTANAVCQSCVGSYILDNKIKEANHESIDACKKCPAGREFFNTTSNCTICSTGKYQSSSSTVNAVCESCIGLSIMDDSKDETKHVSIDNCHACEKGFEIDVTDGRRCVVCGFSHYQDEVGEKNIKCKTCDANFFITDDRKLAVTHQLKGDCVACKSGKFAAEGERFCDNCPAGRVRGSTSCDACDAGTYSTKTDPPSCAACPIGWSSELESTKCQPCEAGTFSNVTGQVCKECEAGQFRQRKEEDGSNITDPTTCVNCPIGKVMPLKGAAKCIDCVPGKYQDKTGESMCIKCSKGRQFNSSIVVGISAQNCLACHKGQYQPDEGSTFCLPCLTGSFENETGSFLCKDCPIGFSNGDGFQLSCDRCAEGKYQDLVQKANCKGMFICPFLKKTKFNL